MGPLDKLRSLLVRLLMPCWKD